MKLTPTQKDLLLHRPEDCIVECLADTEELNITADQAQTAVAEVTAMIETGEIDIVGLNRIQREVFKDMLDGSTYFCDADDAIALGETTKGKVAGAHRNADALEQAYFSVTNERVFIPRD